MAAQTENNPIGQWNVKTIDALGHTYLCALCFGLLKSEFHGRNSQLVGKETHISRQLKGAHVGPRTVSSTDATQQLSLEVWEKTLENQLDGENKTAPWKEP